MITYDRKEEVGAFVAGIVFPNGGGFGNFTAIGVEQRGEIVAGVVYHNWDPEAGVIEMSAASKTRAWLRRDILETLFRYPFAVVGCQMVCARHSENNTRVRRIWNALGADETVVPRMRGRHEDEIVATLTVEQWRAGKFGGSNGQKK